MLWTLSPARRIAAALAVAAGTAALSAAPALGQSAAQVSVNPSQGAPGSQFRISISGYGQCANNSQCIVIDFVEGSTATRIGVATGDAPNAGPLTVPPTATAGSATIHVYSSAHDASTGFTVTGSAPATTTTTRATTTTSSSTTTTTVAPTTTLTTVIPVPSSTTTTTIVTKKSSSHSDVPRYIAVALVVLAAAGTAAVDTQLRRARGPGA